MAIRFTILASSSSGNAGLLDLDGDLVLIDFGLGPRKLTQALSSAGVAIHRVRWALLTHLHGDHWNAATLNRLLDSGVTLVCHAHHAADLRHQWEAFADHEDQGRVRLYEAGVSCSLGACNVEPFALWHDTPTFGFRLECPERTWAMGYASDLGSWAADVVNHLVNVDVLALEFNHDVEMQRTSPRHAALIERNLGDDGHLSNAQASLLLAEVLDRSDRGRMRHLVQLHLSRDCNRPELARSAAERVRRRDGAAFDVHTADPFQGIAWLEVPRTSAPADSAPMRAYLFADWDGEPR